MGNTTARPEAGPPKCGDGDAGTARRQARGTLARDIPEEHRQRDYARERQSERVRSIAAAGAVKRQHEAQRIRVPEINLPPSR